MKDQQKQKKKQKEITLESLYALMHENEERSKREWERIRKEREEEWRKREKEWQKREEEWRKSEEEWRKTREEARKEHEEARERMRELERMSAENFRTIREINVSLGAIGNSNGDFAEEYFQNAFLKDRQLNGETYNEVVPNMRTKECDDEYDIFLSNNKSVAIIEIKYSVKKDDINGLLKKAENFRKFLPEYRNRKLYLGIASLSFRKTTEQNIMKEGIAVIKQVGDKMVIYDKNLKVF